ncbi:MAG: ATP-binding protein, partial [Actinomycetota bacterium]|nr:ATP-binding protein [Actinomycetota bacterium]
MSRVVVGDTVGRRIVGRETTIGALTAAMAAGHPVAVTGEAGIGKTAVLRAAAEQCGRRVFEGGGLATLGWHSYLPLTRALRRPVPAGDHSAVAEFVRGRVRDGLLVVDDAHWADPATLAVLPLLVGEIAVAVGVRAGDAGSGLALSALSSEWLPVGVGPLDPADATRLVSGLAPALDAVTVGAIVAVSGGNPLYLEEQALRGRSAASLRLLVAERLRACSPDARQALAASALLG